MDELSHWDFADVFTASEASALMLGIDPNSPDAESRKLKPVIERMESSYGKAWVHYAFWDGGIYDEDKWAEILHVPEQLHSVDLIANKELGEEAFGKWAADKTQSDFWKQFFSRAELARWLSAIGLKSLYSFERGQAQSADIVALSSDIDPSDFPNEMSAANIAFRAVTNGYGDPRATFKNRLIEYLNDNYSGLKRDAILRIATVANADKTPGRKKNRTE